MDNALQILRYVLGVLSVPLLVLLNSFFVAAEFSLVAVRRTRVEELIKKNRLGATAVRRAISQLDNAIAATQLGITLASLALGWVGEPAIASLLAPLLHMLPIQWLKIASHSVSAIIAFTTITFLHVTVGELAPKAVALQRPDEVSLFVASPLLIFSKFARPAIMLMNGFGNWVVRLLGFKPVSGHQMVHSVEELNLLVEETHRAGVLPADQAEYLQNVFRLSSKCVCDIIVPRDKVAALEVHAPEEKVLEAVREGAHTRMPVFDREFDHVIGIVNTKDLFYLFSLRGVVALIDALYPPLFFPPNMPVAVALREFRRLRKQMAVVRDSNGHVWGIVTLEDIIEEIVGEIEDEHDVPRQKKPQTAI
ncbi:MAG: hemolysin family protein [candidate division KSB1 bacterium]|nr:hemolysin family protein [candidate division KSB1 bacterium]MDZ7301434.1 hemolysin family protein [candidate division KSB1 bacterium]MDZ7313466.1 hemolysin family protein [candidate division KSB1 bacterium]